MTEPAPERSVPARDLRRGQLRARVVSVIVDAAAHELAQSHREVTMADVADAAGVARATIYRYFPNREALVDAVAANALEDVSARLAASRIADVPATEGIVRAVRAIVEVGDALVVARTRLRADPEAFEEAVGAPLTAMFERGQADGIVRDDVPARWLAEALIGLATAGVGASPALGRDDMIAATSSVFLDGARTGSVSIR